MTDLCDYILSGVIVIDKNFKLLELSKEFEIITEYTLPELQEKGIELINDSFLEDIFFKKKNKDYSIIIDEMIIITKNKKEKYIKRKVSFLIKDNEIERIIISIIDIDQYKKYELEIINFQKMETLGEVTKSIAHEYNNLLAAIIGFSSFLKSMINPSNENYSYLKIIENNANKASTLTNQLLSFAGTNYFRQSQININKIIKLNVELFQKTIQSQVFIKLNLYPRDILIHWDENQIHQIIINTILNAKEAVEEAIKNGEIKEGIIEITTNVENSKIIYRITDNGIGISPEKTEKIFEPYYTTKEIDRHTGLGLSVTQGILRNMNGNISLIDNKKTTFVIEMPYKEPSITDLFVNDFRGNNEKILIIDDVDEIRNLATVLLKQKGFEPVGASSGKEAINYLKSEKFDLILLDVVMPEMSGSELFQIIKDITPEIPVILLTGCTDEKLVTDIMKNGSKDIILKPFQTFDFYNKIGKVFL